MFIDTHCHIDSYERHAGESFDALLAEKPALARHLFLFSDFPGVETTLRMLAKFGKNPPRA